MNKNERQGAFSCGTDVRICVQSLRAQHEGAEVAVTLLLETGEHREERRLVIGTAQYCELGLSRGTIEPETFDAIEEAANLWKAMKHGEYLLSFGGNSARQLAQKLRQRGHDREVSERAAANLQGLGLIDENRELEIEVHKCLRKLWGAGRIRTHLWSRGFGEDTLKQLPDLLEDVDFAANCRTLIEKRYAELPTDPNERRRMIASLARYGYSMTEIKTAMSDVRN